MARSEVGRVGKRGTLVDGAGVVMEATPNGVLVRPAVTMPIEVYVPQRRAAFLLSNAVDDEEYEAALQEVRRLGVDPGEVPHRRRGA